MKILLSAYACEPGKGSEPAVGWNWVRQAARRHTVWVITRVNNRTAIEQSLVDAPLPNVRWVYFDLPRKLRFWKRGKRGMHLYYYLWQIGAFRLARRLHAREHFDVVQHVTFVNYWMPSFLGFLGAPFVWGPVGGAESGPRSFYCTFSLKGRLFEHLRDSVRAVANRDPFVRAAARNAAVSLATTEDTAGALRRLGAGQVRVLSQVALTDAEYSQLASLPVRTASPFRVLSIGSLLHLKGFHLGLAAFARFRKYHPAAEYWFLGDGPERKRLVHLARELGISNGVRFLGQLPRSEVLNLLADADALLHPSLHDSGGFVCVEAMAAGRPVICLDLGGPALIVSEHAGIKVPADTPEQTVSALAKAMKTLADDAELRSEMARAGRRRVRELFDWNCRGDTLHEIYTSVAGERVHAETAAD